MAVAQEETVGLLSQQNQDREEIRHAVRQYRMDWCCSRPADKVSDCFSALPAMSQVTSHPTVVRLMLFAGRACFLYDYLSDGLVARALIRGGNPKWGLCVLFFMAVPYVLMVVGLLRKASRTLSARLDKPRWITVPLWLLGGIPACFTADVVLSLKYICSDPASVQEFHYLTLRHLTELVEAQGQLALQGYILLRQQDPGGLFPPVDGAQPVNPWLLGSSVAVSLYTTYETHKKLRHYARNQTGGNIRRFLGHMCELGDGLAPSDIYERLRSRRTVHIAYDLKAVSVREMGKLATASRRARQLEELVFEDASWAQAMVSQSTPQQLVAGLLAWFASAPKLRCLELRCDGVVLPDWAAEGVKAVACSHSFLREAKVEGHEPIMGSFAANLSGAHPLVQAAHAGDLTAVERWEGVAVPTGLCSQALALAANSTVAPQELLRSILLSIDSGLEAVNSSGGPGTGVYLAEDGARPLHFAAAADSREAVELLIVARAALEQNLQDGRTPLHVAATEDCTRALDALLTARVDPDRPDGTGRTALFWAAGQDNAASVQQLLAARADCNIAESTDGSTALHAASQQNASESLRALLRARADVHRARQGGTTALFSAAQHGSLESLELLLGARADVRATSDDGTAPTHMAAKENHLDCLQVLLRARAGVHQARHDGTTALYPAAQEGSLESLELLLGARADVHQARSDTGGAPIHMAAQENHLDCLRALLRARADVHQARHHGITALFPAAQQDSLEILELLLGACADVDQARSDTGGAPIHVAAEFNSVDCLRALLRARADVHRAGYDGDTALSFAAYFGSADCIGPLLQARADPRRDADGRTALEWAQLRGHEAAVSALRQL